jgi:hypothetical protein
VFSHAVDLLPPVEGSELAFSDPGGFDEIVSHIASHRKTLSDSGVTTDAEHAARSWYDTVYLPLTRLVRDTDVLKNLPDRTAADVYLWIINHWDQFQLYLADAVRGARKARSGSRRSLKRRMSRLRRPRGRGH